MTILSTIVPPGIDPDAVARLLDDGRAVHAHRAVVFMANTRPVDLFTAVLVAGFGSGSWPLDYHAGRDLVLAAEVALVEHLNTRDLAAWAAAHSPAEQQNALAEVADKLRTAVA